MTLTGTVRRQVWERQLHRLADSDITRHDLLNAVTALLLLTRAEDWDMSDEVEGHAHSNFTPQTPDVLRNLVWLQVHGQEAPLGEARRRAHAAAQELDRSLRAAYTHRSSR